MTLAMAEQAKLQDPYFKYAVKNIPHMEKRHKGGEDAWVANPRLIVVADGVGGWAEHGVDPGLFSKELCRNIEQIHASDPDETLKEILVSAVQK